MPVRYRTDLVTSLLSIWFMVGLMLDAWAHNNQPDLETFFTPWHAVFYTGFVAVAAWVGWVARDGYRNGRWEPAAMPRTYPAAVLALPLFALAGFGDATWHQIFGIEQSIDILFSPTHLALAASMMVIITTPARSYWSDPELPDAPGFRRAFPAMLSTALGATLVLLFLQYGNALTYYPDNINFALSGGGVGGAAEVSSSVFMTNLVMVVPLLVLARRARLPFGAATLLYLLLAALGVAITGFERLELPIAVIGTGIVVDVLAQVLRVGPSQAGRYRAFGFLAPLLTWAVYLAVAAGFARAEIVAENTRPDSAVELWTGIPVVQGIFGLLLASLLLALRTPGAVPAAPVDQSEVDKHPVA